MKTLKLTFAAGILLAAFQTTVRADVPAVAASGRGIDWLTHYYQHPRPDLLPLAVHELSREGYFETVGQPATAIGFFATVFEQNPTQIDYWLHETTDLPRAHRKVLVAAAWMAGSPRGAELLGQMAQNCEGDTAREVAQAMRREPTHVAGTPVRSESSMNLQWGAFLATGDEQPIVSVLIALGSSDAQLSGAARYALAQNAVEHPRVLDICRDQLAKQPESVSSELRAALNDVGLLKKPGA